MKTQQNRGRTILFNSSFRQIPKLNFTDRVQRTTGRHQMQQSPTISGKLNRHAAKAVQALTLFAAILAANAIDAAPKGKKPAAAPVAVANTGATGTIRGKVLDSANGEPMIGVTAVIKDLGLYGITDIDGNYTIANVPVGNVTVTYQITGYQSASTAVNVAQGKPARANVTMNYKVSGEVVVTAKRVDNTTASLLSKQKKAAAAQDAISSEQIAKSPDADAADSAKRVTGVNIVDGKTVYIRGLGERYSGVMFAGSNIPSPDPDKRVVPLDIFPVGLLDNLIVVKTHTPDLPGEFGGGLVQVNPKDFPDEMTARVSLGIGGNSQTTGQTFKTYEGGKHDWFGIDDGTRAQPGSIGTFPASSSYYSAAQLQAMGRDFKNIYSIKDSKGLPNGNVSAEFGNTYKFSDTMSLGMIFSGMYRETFVNQDQKFRRVNQSFADLKKYDIKKSTFSTIKGALGSLSFSPTKSDKIRYTTFYSERSEDSTSDYIGFNSDRQENTDPTKTSTERINRLNYINTGLWFNQLAGQHKTNLLDMTFDWTASHSIANRSEPDRRDTIYLDKNSTNNYVIFRPESDIRRFFQKHTEKVTDFQPSVSIPFNQWQGLKSKFTLGGSYSYRLRESASRTFSYDHGAGELQLNGQSLESYLVPENIVGTTPVGNQFRISETTASADSYTGKLTIAGGFGMVDIPLFSQLRLVAGARYENSKMDVTNFDPLAGKITGLAKNPLKEDNILPSANLIFAATDNINLRLAFSQTIARPDFREVTLFKYNPMVGTETVIGNPNLVQTDIYNYDFRFEWFPKAAEVVALSFFLKDMRNPIEMLEITGTPGTYTFQFQNAKKALNLGAEIEARKGLGFIWSGIDSFSILANAAYIHSQVTVQDTALATYSIKDRALQGQAPYTVNLGFDHNWESIGLTSSLLGNVNGRRIMRVGTVYSGTPIGDVYEESYVRMDFVMRKTVFAKGHLKLAIGNILNPEIRQTQRIVHATTKEIKEFELGSFRTGITVMLTYSQQF